MKPSDLGGRLNLNSRTRPGRPWHGACIPRRREPRSRVPTEVPMNASRTPIRLTGARLLACALVLAALGGPAREGFAQTSADVQRALEVDAGRDRPRERAALLSPGRAVARLRLPGAGGDAAGVGARLLRLGFLPRRARAHAPGARPRVLGAARRRGRDRRRVRALLARAHRRAARSRGAARARVRVEAALRLPRMSRSMRSGARSRRRSTAVRAWRRRRPTRRASARCGRCGFPTARAA
jgi:hypothetical protein